jgi:hypothetical protein
MSRACSTASAESCSAMFPCSCVNWLRSIEPIASA